ncbi:Nephrocystin-3, partial [Bienertia sinuspersici]
LVFGGSCSLVFAEESSNGKSSESDTGESTNAGLQRVEDGSVISNEHTSKWRIFTDSGREYFLKGKLNEAEKLFSSALAEAKIGFGERDPHVASACNNLVSLYPLLLEWYSTNLSLNPRIAMDVMPRDQAELYRVQKSFDQAEPLYVEAISILQEVFGQDDVRVGAAFHNLGQFYIVQRKFEEARMSYEVKMMFEKLIYFLMAAVENTIKGRVLGHGHADYAETMFHLGTVLYLQEHTKDAEALIQDSIQTLEVLCNTADDELCVTNVFILLSFYYCFVVASMQEGGQGESVSCLRKLRYLAKVSN